VPTNMRVGKDIFRFLTLLHAVHFVQSYYNQGKDSAATDKIITR